MSSNREIQRILDIVDNIDAIEIYVEDMNVRDFSKDRKTVDACERCLTRISEAAVKIGATRLKEFAPTLPGHTARGLGNVLRHEYDRIDVEIIFNTIANDLPNLRRECIAELARLEDRK